MRIGSRACVAGLLLGACAALDSPVHAQTPDAVDPAGIDRLMRDSNGQARVSLHPATGAARFVRLAPDAAARDPRAARVPPETDFFRRYGTIFGIRDFGAELRQVDRKTDSLGYRHTAYAQQYKGVPVFAGVLRTHVDGSGRLYSVNGTFVPGLDLNIVPTRTAADAGAVARSAVGEQKPAAAGIAVRGTKLYVFREGLAKGVEGTNHLAWEVEVGNGRDVREFVYVDAHTGKIVDQITGIYDALNRRAFDGQNNPNGPPTYPGTPFWVEGDPFPSTGTCVQGPGLPDCNDEADNMIIASKETYDLYSHGFARDSFDGLGSTMDSIFDRGYDCPNASWNGTFISFCPGFTTDDVTSHEWSHAYTQYTSNLIYQWQPGALNESYSDIFGETVDLLNGRMTDAPGEPRTEGNCSDFTPPRAQLQVTAPPSIAGNYAAQSAQFGPALTPAGVPGNVVVALDAANPTGPSTTDACTALTNAGAVAGKIALVDRGTCLFTVKVQNAQDAGAIGVIVANNVASGLPGMGGTSATITIPSIGVQQSTGNSIKAELANGPVSANIRSSTGSTDTSYRWLLGEDVVDGGALRDMWSPGCYSNPAKVTDTAFYTCATTDGGGVHTNSGVPNHGYALLVDGGTFNGQTVAGLGLTKAAHIYFRAQAQYQVPASDFADHADALEQSCDDLVGVDLANLLTGAPSGQMISAGDCAEVTKMIAAVELRTGPTFCNFQPLLAKNPPPRCAAGLNQVNVFLDTFESSSSRRRRAWVASEEPVTPADFTPRSWERVTNLPDGRIGYAMFGPDPDIGTCAPGGDESAVLRLQSPAFPLTGAGPFLLTFDHWVATEAGYDGGLLEISVNGGPWTQIAVAAFTYNSYNIFLITAGAGNTNPLAGKAAFSGTDGGQVDGSWGRSHVNLSTYATTGDNVRLRFSLGNDGCGGSFGWYVDDVTVYACRP
jgi:Zn-dependent metalloprotease